MNNLFMPKEQVPLEDLVRPYRYFEDDEVIVYASSDRVLYLEGFDSEPELLFENLDGPVKALYFSGDSIYVSSGEQIVDIFNGKRSPLSPYGDLLSVTGYDCGIIAGCEDGGLINLSKGFTLRSTELSDPISAMCHFKDKGYEKLYVASGEKVICVDPLENGHLRLSMDCVARQYPGWEIGALQQYDDMILVALNDPKSGRNCKISSLQGNMLTQRDRHVKAFFEFGNVLYDVISDGGINRSIKGDEVYHTGGRFHDAVVVPSGFLERKLNE